MGLDSVEYIMNIEKFFKIQIKDEQAEKINSLDDLALCISKILNIKFSDERYSNQIKNIVLEKLKSTLNEEKIILTDKISKFVPMEKSDFWNGFKKEFPLLVPKIQMKVVIENFIAKWFSYQSDYVWEEMTVEEFVEGIIIFNYKELLDNKEFCNQKQIYYLCAGILCESMDVDVFDIKPHKSITKDYGID